jgi:hypothetical protein
MFIEVEKGVFINLDRIIEIRVSKVEVHAEGIGGSYWTLMFDAGVGYCSMHKQFDSENEARDYVQDIISKEAKYGKQ